MFLVILPAPPGLIAVAHALGSASGQTGPAPRSRSDRG